MESVQSVVDEGWKMVMKKKEEVKEGEEEEGEQAERCCLLKERCDQRRSEWRKKKPKIGKVVTIKNQEKWSMDKNRTKK